MRESPPQVLVERLKDYDQEHVFALWDELSASERISLIADIETLDVPRTDRIIRRSLASHAAAAFDPLPDSAVSTVESRRPEEKERWWKQGLKAISDGKLAVVLLAGGQGSRLGSSDPKGCFNIGLPSGKSLFQLYAERILCVQRLAGGPMQIHVYVMTSPFTDDLTRRFFEAHRFFGLDSDQVRFFEQGTIPCVSKEGRFVMERGRWRVGKAPDGSGGVYAALTAAGLLDAMAARGVRYVDCCGVDNALARVADPAFVGHLVERGAQAAAKVVRKAYPQPQAESKAESEGVTLVRKAYPQPQAESKGVFVRKAYPQPQAESKAESGGVVELDSLSACAVDQHSGRLRHRWSNACHHLFTLDFLHQVSAGLEKDAVFHLVSGSSAGVFRLEQFVVDAFPYAQSAVLYEVTREEEFAPVKNANGAAGVFDTPDSARLMVLRLHSRWVVAAGGFLTHSVPLYATGVEVSPLCSYAGENLEHVCRGRTFHAPCEITF